LPLACKTNRPYMFKNYQTIPQLLVNSTQNDINISSWHFTPSSLVYGCCMPWLFTLGNHNKLIVCKTYRRMTGHRLYMVAICHRGSTINRLAFWFQEDQAASQQSIPALHRKVMPTPKVNSCQHRR
jgi:hypothetical protein